MNDDNLKVQCRTGDSSFLVTLYIGPPATITRPDIIAGLPETELILPYFRKRLFLPCRL
jgi:hypothetical protein